MLPLAMRKYWAPLNFLQVRYEVSTHILKQWLTQKIRVKKCINILLCFNLS